MYWSNEEFTYDRTDIDIDIDIDNDTTEKDFGLTKYTLSKRVSRVLPHLPAYANATQD